MAELDNAAAPSLPMFRWRHVHTFTLERRSLAEFRDDDRKCTKIEITWRDGRVWRGFWRDVDLGGGYGNTEAELAADIARRPPGPFLGAARRGNLAANTGGNTCGGC